MKCDKCGYENEDENVFNKVDNGDNLCETCLRQRCVRCVHCEVYIYREDSYTTYNDYYLCEDCRNEDYSSCNDCGGYVSHEDSCEDENEDTYCPRCIENQGHSEPRNLDKYQSKNYGSIIKSKRTFGIELELLTNINLSDEIDSNFGLKGDGSLDTNGTDFRNTVEIVTPVLMGKKGEEAMLELGETLKLLDVGVNKSCGLHVHLGAKDFLQKDTKLVKIEELEKFKKDNEDDDYTAFYLPSSIYAKFVDKFNTHDLDEIIAKVCSKGFRHSDFESFDDGFFYKDDRITENVIDDNTMVIMKSLDDNIEKLKNLLKFYLIFEPVIMCSQPRSRRDSNSYSAPINNSFSINDVDKIETYDQFDQYWYKTSNKRDIKHRKQDKYSSARYYSFNFHALLCGTNGCDGGFKTLEIRLHSGTKNAKKILYWTYFHQAILDRISQEKITAEDLEKASGLFSVLDKMNLMFRLLNLNNNTETAIKKRIEKFGLNDRPNQEDHSRGIEDDISTIATTGEGDAGSAGVIEDEVLPF